MPAIITARDWTIVAWCKYRSSVGVKSGFKLDNGEDDNTPPNTNCMISFSYSSGNWVVEGLNGSLVLGPTTASAATADTWYMLAIRCADDVAQNPRYRYSVNAGAFTAIGAGGAGARSFNTIGFYDSVDEVQIYQGTDATPVNLTTIYNGGAPTEFTSPYPSTLSHYWKFNNNVTDTVGGFTINLNSGGSYGTGIISNDLQWSGTGLFGASNTSDVAVATTKSHGTVGWLSYGTGKSTFYAGGTRLRDFFITDAWLIDQYVGSKLFVFGMNQYGQLGDNSITNRSTPVQTVDFGGNWEQAARSFYRSGGIKSDGTLWTWGYNTAGELGQNTSTTYRSSPVQTVAGGTNWKYLSMSLHAVATKLDNTIWTWGLNSSGQLGDNTSVNKSSPIQVGTAANWIQATGGSLSSAGIKDDNTLWLWGDNTYGQLGDNTTTNKSSPAQVLATDPFYSLVSILLNLDGTNGSTTFVDRGPSQLTVTAVSTANITTTSPKYGNGSLKLNGTSDYIAVTGNTSIFSFPGDFTVEGWVNFTALPTASNYAGFFFARGASAAASAFQFYMFNNAGTYRLETTISVGSTDYGNTYNLPSAPSTGVWYHFAFVRTGSSLIAYWNGSQVGSAATVPGTTNAPTTQISIGARGTPFAGLYLNGKIDDFRVSRVARYTSTFTPPEQAFSVGPSGGWNYVSISNSVAAIATDNSLWTWGYNILGQLGDNSTTNRSSPVQVMTKSQDWFKVSAGGSGHMAGIKTDGSLWLWGGNAYGELGDNTINHRSSPVQTVAGGTNWKYVSCGYKHTAAIKNDGTLWVWGFNGVGQLGDNTVIMRSSPIQTLAGGSLWKQVECGYMTTFATTFSG